MSENTRYVPAEASYTNRMTDEVEVPSWGVLDTVENKFAPFGGSEELAKFAAERVAAMPYLPWTFLDEFTLAAKTERFEWTGAIYTEWNGESATAYGAVDNELARFYPFSDRADDPDGLAFVADVASSPEGKYQFADAYTKTN
ncbi:hypothetical protein SEA_KAYLISSA_55 [Arthrobacter phage Kaylissa]|uniref:Uncharacterized protein n=1 Tax=Arthrobacter phage Kaylissa TaxID=2835951 RepID=A0AA92N3U5_9CAUD|nr:hypothetical protein PQE14_gp55 [Arthrobacter phage Kaylissa]QXO14589.1 hypothetical protein SEA_KAYLISSA_55 [Arthrobacter phage Kaylissa]